MGEANPLSPRVIGFSMMFSASFAAVLQGFLRDEWDWGLFFILLGFGAVLSGLAMVLVTFINRAGINRADYRPLPPE